MEQSAGSDPDPAFYYSRQTTRTFLAAVLPFGSEEGIAFFDAWVTGEVIRRLSAAKNLTLIERSRIDIVLQEHALMQSGIISGKDTLRIGALLAADQLVTGTYSYKDETIFVRGRVLDAKSGKIENVFAFQLPYQGNKTKDSEAEGMQADQGCESIQRPVLKALYDLSTPAAVEHAVDRAIRIPWKKPCGQVHIIVTHTFAKYNLYPRRYHEFLAKTLENMEPSGDDYNTIKDIFRYFAFDYVITEFEWAAGREILKRSWHPVFLMRLFYERAAIKTSKMVLRRRANELLELAKMKEIGRPFAFSEKKIQDDLCEYAKVCIEKE